MRVRARALLYASDLQRIVSERSWKEEEEEEFTLVVSKKKERKEEEEKEEKKKKGKEDVVDGESTKRLGIDAEQRH